MNFISTLILPLRVVLPQAVSNLSLTSESGSSAAAVSHAKQLLGSLMPNRGHNHGDIDKEHKFWSTQPVLSLSETLQIEESGPIDVQKSVGDVKNEEYNMPAGFKWVSIDIEDPNELFEINPGIDLKNKLEDYIGEKINLTFIGTATHFAIRNLRKLFQFHSFLGYTATPNANDVLTWSGTAWAPAAAQGGGGGGANVTISDTIPAGTPSAGDLWWESDTGRLKIYYQDTDTIQWVDVNAPLRQDRIATTGAPSAASDTGVAGDIRYDSGYVYIAVATNTWKRAALTTW